MPLNMQEKDEFPMEEDGSAPPPIKRTGAPKGPMFTTVTLVVLLVAILAAGSYLLYRYRVFAPSAPPATAPAAPGQPSALVNPWKADSAKPSEPAAIVPATPAPEAAEAPASVSGRFAVFISSYRDRSDAEEEVRRWVAAGFSSFVSDFDGWHRVAFGRFADAQSAEREAERWKPAFEYGYWIGPAD